MPNLETSRLILKELTNDHAALLFGIYAHEPTMRRYGLAVHTHVEQTKQTIELLRSEFAAERGLRFGMFLKRDHTLVGDCGIWQLDKRRLRGELGGKIAPQFAGNGLMTEALHCIATYAFTELKLHALEGNITTDNLASIRMVEKLGFSREGMRREFTYCLYEQRYKDSYLFSLLKKDFLRSGS